MNKKKLEKRATNSSFEYMFQNAVVSEVAIAWGFFCQKNQYELENGLVNLH